MPMGEEEEDDTLHMIVQIRTDTFWGTEEEFELRIKVGDLLEQVFERADSGYFDGGDSGSHSMNLFSYGIRPADWEKVLVLTLNTLRQNNLLLDNMVIVKSMPIRGSDDREDIVAWPSDFKGTFSIF
jgi:hypothetical protein